MLHCSLTNKDQSKVLQYLENQFELIWEKQDRLIVFIYKLFPPFSTTFQLEFIKGQITNLIIVIINYVNTLAAPRLRHFMMIILIMTMIAMTVNYVKSS